MAELRAFFAELGFEGARTLLQSGNVVFEAEAAKAPNLEELLGEASVERLGAPIEFIVRTDSELRAAIARNPFPDEAANDPGHLLVMFLKRPVTSGAVRELQAKIKGPEVVRGEGSEVYISYPDGMGTSKLTINVIEKALGCRCTGRNWNTVLKLAAMV